MRNWLMILCFCLLISGCGGRYSLTKGQESVDLTQESIALFSIKIANQFKPDYQPDVNIACIGPKEFGAGSSINVCCVDISEPIKTQENTFKEYLVAIRLKPGHYDKIGISATYTIPVVFSAYVQLSLKTAIDLNPKSIVYLGHINAVIRERKSDDEIRAGSKYPLIDQSVAGFSTGTFDISIEDRYDEDIKQFSSVYPLLQKTKVDKSIIPQDTKIIDQGIYK